ncbi:MAG: polysulfide reductase NrfD [Chitinophagaceae bacterium]|nr:polysulfide reductase NrfD [Oligoflexus sp.]
MPIQEQKSDDHFSLRDESILPKGESFESVTRSISNGKDAVKGRLAFRLSLLAALGMVFLLCVAVTHLFIRGIGIFGNNMPSAWGFPIVNFVWWIGIGHAGTFISAILLILHQNWRDSINRFAEAMTLVAVLCAAMMPLIHLGRPIVFYWLIPYPNSMNLWPQFRSPLMWDMFAVGTYGTISLLFFFVGLIPDMATFRDRAKSRFGQYFYGAIAGGWRGSARHWSANKTAYVILAGLATPLVVSVHSIVALDFASSILPAWHSEIFPPYFVAGAIYSGFAMVLCISVLLRRIFDFGRYITQRHINTMVYVMMSTGLIVAYAYLVEAFIIWYSQNPPEIQVALDHYTGAAAPVYWSVIVCNIVIPQILWLRWARCNSYCVFIVCIIINIGMWLERFLIVVSGLSRDYLMSSWAEFHPTLWDFALLLGLLGLFSFCLLLFVRYFPVIPMYELRSSIFKSKAHPKSSEVLS